MTNAFETLLKKVNEMKELSQIYRENSLSSSTYSVPDVLDITASLVSAVINSKNSSKNDELNANLVHDIESVLNLKEKKFIARTESKINSTAEHLNKINETYSAHLSKFQDTVDKIAQIHNAAVSAEREKLEIEVNKAEKEWEAERSELLQQERLVFQSIEGNTAAVLKKISEEYKEKLESADNEIKESQTSLNSIIHDKYQQGKARSKDLEQEERRVAAEHEKITHDYQARKDILEKETEELNQKIDKLKHDIENENEDSKDKIKRLEKSMIEEHRKIETDQKEKLEEINKKIKRAKDDYEDKLRELKDVKKSKDRIINAIDEEYAEKLKFERELTQSVCDQIKEALEAEFNPRFEILSEQIAEEEKNKGMSYETMKRELVRVAEANEKETQKLNMLNSRELTNINKKKSDLKNKLQVLKNQMENDLDELKHARQREVGKEMQILDDQQVAENEEINAIMRQFDKKQSEINEIHQMTVEMRNKKKADQLKELKEIHQERKEKILRDIEKQMQDEIDEELNQKIEAINKRIPLTMKGVEIRGNGLKQRINRLSDKLDYLIASNTRLVMKNVKKKTKSLSNIEFDQVQGILNESLLPSLRSSHTSAIFSIPEETSEDEAPKVSEARAKILEKLNDSISEAEKRKSVVVEEAKDLSDKINKMADSFASRILQIDHQFAASKCSIIKTRNDLDTKKKAIEDSVLNQEQKLGFLQERINTKNKEVEEFENALDMKTEEYKNELVKKQEEQLQEAKQDGDHFQTKMKELNDEFKNRVSELMEKLQKSKQSTERIAKYMLKQREQMLEEVEAEIGFANEERIKIIKENHFRRMKEMERDFADKKEVYIQMQRDNEENYEEKLQKEKNLYQEKMSDLEQEKYNLNIENEELSAKMDGLMSKECESCTKKKEIIRELLKKREKIQNCIHEHKESQLLMESKMNSIFKDDKKGSKAVSPRFFVPRAKTALSKVGRI